MDVGRKEGKTYLMDGWKDERARKAGGVGRGTKKEIRRFKAVGNIINKQRKKFRN